VWLLSALVVVLQDKIYVLVLDICVPLLVLEVFVLDAKVLVSFSQSANLCLVLSGNLTVHVNV